MIDIINKNNKSVQLIYKSSFVEQERTRKDTVIRLDIIKDTPLKVFRTIITKTKLAKPLVSTILLITQATNTASTVTEMDTVGKVSER